MMQWWKKVYKLWQNEKLRRREGFLVYCPCDTMKQLPLNAKPAIGAVCGFYEYECEACGSINEFDLIHYPVPVLYRRTTTKTIT